MGSGQVSGRPDELAPTPATRAPARPADRRSAAPGQFASGWCEKGWRRGWTATRLPDERGHDGPRDGILTSGPLPLSGDPTALEIAAAGAAVILPSGVDHHEARREAYVRRIPSLISRFDV